MKWVYCFSEGNKDMQATLGGKGANLAEMTALGLNVPPGFTISTLACRNYLAEQALWPALKEAVFAQLQTLEKQTGKTFLGEGDGAPLLLSVRSGAPVSMPGMMDTILNLGLNDQTVQRLAERTQNAAFAWDSYRRFIEMFANVVAEIPRSEFEQLLDEVKKAQGYQRDSELTPAELQQLTAQYKAIYARHCGTPFPDDPPEQLCMAIEAVFKSWNNPRARTYRDLHHIPHDLGTAVNVQSMVFGNMGDTSGTGVLFSRNPINGQDELFGEYLLNAQGEDVVAGTRTPQPIASLQEAQPAVYRALYDTAKKLEHYFKDIQDIEFTIENGQLYLLQARSAKRTALAAIAIVTDLVCEGLIDKATAIRRITPEDLQNLLHPVFDADALAGQTPIAQGMAASPGAASGRVCFHPQEVLAAKARGEQALLVREETSPEDIEGMIHAEGILTAKGGMTSHAAVVARGIGKCCVTGCDGLTFHRQQASVTLNGETIHAGDVLSIDGSTGRVYRGAIPKVELDANDHFATFLSWLDDYRPIGVRANADTPRDAQKALQFNADGIGLCRTEHMFFHKDRIATVRSMILAQDDEERRRYLTQLLAFQRDDFAAIFRVMRDRPVTIRLLDPPLHEFLPRDREETLSHAQIMQLDGDEVQRRIDNLRESNPMLGHRGCRLAITWPEIYQTQTQAIIEAALAVQREGIAVAPEIMIPLVCDKQELTHIKQYLETTIDILFAQHGRTVPYTIGTMIETPRAALLADEIAEEAAFFSFGTNDLTQMTLGFSRDDSNKFLDHYLQQGIFADNPFNALDQKGVGKLIAMATQLGRAKHPQLKIGVCGEQAGDAQALALYSELGINYLSCSPYRIPLLKLALARFALRQQQAVA